MESRGRYRCYDHRVRNTIVESANPDLFPELEIPRSTALDWIGCVKIQGKKFA